MIPIPLLVFYFARAFGSAKSLVNLITKLNNCASYKLTELLRSSERCQSNMAALNWYIFRKNRVVCHQRVPKF